MKTSPEYELAFNFVKEHHENDEAISNHNLADLFDNARDKNLSIYEVETHVRQLAKQYKVKMVKK